MFVASITEPSVAPLLSRTPSSAMISGDFRFIGRKASQGTEPNGIAQLRRLRHEIKRVFSGTPFFGSRYSRTDCSSCQFGPGYNDPPAHSVIEVLADAVTKKDPRTRKLWFDVASNAHPTNPAQTSELLVKLIRQIGVKRILYGSDAAAGSILQPRESWEAFRQLKLSKKELKTIARNVAPYLR